MRSPRSRLVRHQIDHVQAGDDPRVGRFLERLLSEQREEELATATAVDRLILHTSSDPALGAYARRSFRRAEADLAVAGTVYIDQADLAEIPGFRRWGTDGGLGTGLSEFTASVATMAGDRISNVRASTPDGPTTVLVSGGVLFGLGAYRGPVLGRRLPASMRVLRALTGLIPATTSSVVVHHPGDEEAFGAMYEHYVHRGGSADSPEVKHVWRCQGEFKLQDWVDRVKALEIARDVEVLELSRSGPASAFSEGWNSLDPEIGSRLLRGSDTSEEPFPDPASLELDRVRARSARTRRRSAT